MQDLKLEEGAMSFPRVGLAPLLAVIGVAIAGCGSSSNGNSSAAAASSSTTTAHATSSAAASSGTSSRSTGRQVTITTKHDKKLGTILAAGKKELTVYLFEGDKKGLGSACSGQCAKFWPPVIGKGVATAKASASELGTISRSGGTTQVTYKGHPLYYFIKDKDGEDAYGQAIKAFGADWYVLTPSGNKIDES
jgi:predicted lipoprotein with Yx(FWY)xxD motif